MKFSIRSVAFTAWPINNLRVSVLFACAMFVSTMLGCGAEQGETLIDEQIISLEKTTRVLRSVVAAEAKFRDDRNEAAFHQKLAEANGELSALREATTKLGPRIKALKLSSSERSRLEEKFDERFKKALLDFRTEGSLLKNLEIDDPAFRDFQAMIKSSDQPT